MSSEIAIRAENLGKIYRIGDLQGRYDTLRDQLADVFKFPHRWLKKLKSRRMSTECTIWALKNVSFEVRRGEVFGIVGRNGAGKTTLLRILSRITEPTEGYAEIYGRVGSLLEVGTGFHPELTGRENIFLNGSILGMKRSEIQRKLDEIIAFAEIEKFIDTPVKRYSSGMYVRLAFAVAAHMEPEILLVDEVLAVGDVAFQKKCLGKMGDISREGRTIFFVSHNMAAVSALCKRAIFLDSGKLELFGSVHECVQKYIASSETNQPSMGAETNQLISDRQFRFYSASVSQAGSSGSVFYSHLPIKVIVEYEILEAIEGLRVGFDLFMWDGTHIFETCDDDDPGKNLVCRKVGRYQSIAYIPGNLLNVGKFTMKIQASIHMVRWLVRDQVSLVFHIEQIAGVNSHYVCKYSRPGIIMPMVEWVTISIPGKELYQ